jgi:hypothetical protein
MAALAACFRLYLRDGEISGQTISSRMEKLMKTIAKTFTLAALTALALGIAPTAKAADKGCSAASLLGTFAYTSVGSIVAPAFVAGPYAEVGTQIFDGKGGVTFTLMSSQNGNIGPATQTGTYTVNSDCTGTFTQGDPTFTAHFSFVLDESTGEFRAICLDSGAIITRVGRRQFPVGDWRQ